MFPILLSCRDSLPATEWTQVFLITLYPVRHGSDSVSFCQQTVNLDRHSHARFVIHKTVVGSVLKLQVCFR